MIAIGDGYIGNSRQQNDNLIAVSSARRLGDFCRALTELFKPGVRAEIEAGRKSLFGVYDLEWLAQLRAETKAIHILQGAIGAGELRLWRVHDGREVQIVPLRLLHNDIRYGIFKTFDRPEPDMQGAWLWVKYDDWEAFVARAKSGFSALEGKCNAETLSSSKKKPGPRPDPAWAAAISEVTSYFQSRGYSQPLKRGQQNAIARRLLDAMMEKTGNAYSNDQAVKYIKAEIIPALPLRSAE